MSAAPTQSLKDAYDLGVATALDHAKRQPDGITLKLETWAGKPWPHPDEVRDRESIRAVTMHVAICPACETTVSAAARPTPVEAQDDLDAHRRIVHEEGADG